MACSYPLRAIKVGDTVVVKKRSDLVGTDLGTFIDLETGEYVTPFDIPCGKCLQCRLDYAKTWAYRCLLESRSWTDNWFLTLTYDDKCVPYSSKGFQTLRSDDLKDFLKRLRSHYDEKYGHQNIRFYACGEYGDTTFRPHYHMLAFNLPLGDLKVYSKSPLGDVYYNSPTLDDKWGNGYVVVGELTEQSAAYTARYVQKKATKEAPDYQALGLEKEFVRMSRRPGIGAYYFEENFEKIMESDKIYLPGGKVMSAPRYFDRLADRRGESLDCIKSERRRRAELATELKLQLVSEDYTKYLLELEEVHAKRAKSLRRNL